MYTSAACLIPEYDPLQHFKQFLRRFLLHILYTLIYLLGNHYSLLCKPIFLTVEAIRLILMGEKYSVLYKNKIIKKTAAVKPAASLLEVLVTLMLKRHAHAASTCMNVLM